LTRRSGSICRDALWDHLRQKLAWLSAWLTQEVADIPVDQLGMLLGDPVRGQSKETERETLNFQANGPLVLKFKAK
jgi:hypothetical protein